ncbi:MAG: BON domain-containing protein [Alphaproteobacteria bacterium]
MAETALKSQPVPRAPSAPARAVLVALALLAPLMSGCVEAVVGAAATTGVAASQERGLGGAAGDLQIRSEINYLWLKHNEQMYVAVGLNVHEGRVLLTGKVPTPQARVDAVRLAWQAKGVKEVINEIQVDQPGGISEYASDAWISNQLRARLLFDGDVSSINYSVVTVAGTVYLLGIARSQAELDRVTTHARNVANVRRVISYVRVKQPGES